MTTELTRSELTDLLERAASEVAERDLSGLSDDTPLAALGIDSLGMLELIGTLERELQIYVPDDRLVGITTVRDLLELLEARADGADASAEVVRDV